MSKDPIIIVAGEPNSVFLEIFFKSIQFSHYKRPIIIIVNKKLLKKQMQKLGFFFEINIINKKYNKFKELNNKKINLINVEYKFNHCFEKISVKSNSYIKESFDIGLKIIKQNKLSRFINGPISKKYFLKGKALGITEYLAKKIKKLIKLRCLSLIKNCLSVHLQHTWH